MLEWLDTETKAMLQQAPPEKLAPADTGMFTLVLLQKGNDASRLVRALARILGVSPRQPEVLAARTCPLSIVSSLSLADALLGQFELVCCDSISVFLRDDIVSSGDRHYLNQLYRQFPESPEFKNVAVKVISLPDTVLAQHFVDQFLGEPNGVVIAGAPSHCESMMRKKARIMAHWAQKIGAEVVIADDA
jgi:hypothetical protein